MNDAPASTETARGVGTPTADTMRFLNRCIAACEDGEWGFASAASDVRGPKLKELFRSLALQRADFVRVLEGSVRTLGVPETASTATASSRRSWTSYRRKVDLPDDRSVLEGCVAADEVTLEVYEAAQARFPMPPAIAAAVDDQHDAIQRAHADLRAVLAAW